MTELPETIEFEGKIFHLVCEQVSQDTTIIPGWWWAGYFEFDENGNQIGLPPNVVCQEDDGKFWEYLMSTFETKEETIADLLDRLNRMINADIHLRKN